MSDELPEVVPPDEVAELRGSGFDVTADKRVLSARNRMVALRSDPLEAHQDAKKLYEDLCWQMWTEAEAIPGFGTLHDMAIELAAYMWAMHKVSQDGGEIGPLSGAEYDRLARRFEGLFKAITSATNEAAAEDAFKREFMTRVLEVIDEALKQSIPDLELRGRVLRKIVEILRDEIVPKGRKR